MALACTLYYFDCQVLNESFLLILLPSFFCFFYIPYFVCAQLIRFYHVFRRTLNLSFGVEFYSWARFLSLRETPAHYSFITNKTRQQQQQQKQKHLNEG